MHKVVWLALALGAVGLLKRESHKRGITTSKLLSEIFARVAGRFMGDESGPSEIV